MKYSRLKIKAVIAVLIFFVAHFNTVKTHATTMDSNQYHIESASVTDGAINTSSDNYKLSDTLGQLAAGRFSSDGYVIKAGFQYLHSIIPFQFTVSDINIDLGSLVPQTPATQTTDLTVNFGSAGLYQVTVIEESKLKTLSNKSIPDTTCNGGANTCSESTAKVWNSSSSYGFGYNMSGDDIPADFTDSTYYRPFADRSQSESPQVVMTSVNVGENRQSTMTFKVNVSALQEAGSYNTVVSFIATPSY